MAGKNFVFNMSMKLDTKVVEQNLAKLKTSLQNITTGTDLGITMTKGLVQAQHAADDLRLHMEKAMNVNTGNLDLSKFNRSLRMSGQSLSVLTSQLLNAGVQGEEAFLRTHQAIANANVKLKTSNTLLSGFLMTLKNTAKWQLSSSLLQGFINGIRNAISFTKELDKSLNDIRIVTGYSAERMADFAVQANKAAKELSTTTKNYTDASLIFFQQGLSDEEVKARTDVTIKMARVTGEAASDVSSYMTAIWNNFDDGSHSLEHYADVITALGAATASSSEEIAGGLEKFAAIADTVGLSYEYATSALATVVAETRQSEETVGTSFKTIFGRLQSLNLGENLDDGTSLTKYSQALDVVGISIKEQDGALKSMNDILDELGSKWAGLSQETKVALANTVAGTRQYTNFIALMDSYDTFKINLDIAENAEGTMDEQFKIYEDSWEGAQMRMKASAESLYSSLVPKEFLVDAVDGLGKFLDGLTEIVESFGGLKGILLTISTILLNKFQPQIAGAINIGIDKLRIFKQEAVSGFNEVQGKGFFGFFSKLKGGINAGLHGEERQITKETNKSLQAASADKTITDPMRNRINSLIEANELQRTANNLADKMTETEKASVAAQLDMLQKIKERRYEEEVYAEVLANEVEASKLILDYEVTRSGIGKTVDVDKGTRYDISAAKAGLTRDEEFGVLSLFPEQGRDEKGRFLPHVASFTDDTTGERTLRLDSEDSLNTAAEAVHTGIERGTGIEATVDEFAGLDVESQIELMQQLEKIVGEFNETQRAARDELMADLEEEKRLRQELLKIEAEINEIEATPENKRTAAQRERLAELQQKKKTGEDGISTQTTKVAKSKQKFRSTGTEEVKNAKNLGKILQANRGETDKIEKSTKALVKTKASVLKNEKQSNKIVTQLRKTYSKLSTSGKDLGKNISSFAGGVSQAITGVTMLTNAFQKLKDGEFTFADLGSSMMAITMIAPQLISALGGIGNILAINNLKKKDSIAVDELKAALLKEDITKEQISQMLQAKGISQDKAEMLAEKLLTETAEDRLKVKNGEISAEEADTAATIANTIATYASIPPVLIIMAILIALIAIILLVASALKAQAEARAKDAETARKEAEVLKEETQAQNEALQAYTEAFKKYQETKQGKEELVEAGKKLMETYGMERGEVELLRGEYEKFNEILAETVAAKAKANAQAAQGSALTQAGSMIDVVTKKKGFKSDGKVKFNFNSGASAKDETAILQALQSKTWETLFFESGAGKNDIRMQFDSSDPNAYVTAFDEAMELLELARKYNGGKKPADSEIYNEIEKEIGTWENISALRDTVNLQKSEERKEQRYSITSKSGKKITSISDIRDYSSYRENLEATGKFTAEELNADLASDEFSKELESTYKNFNAIAMQGLGLESDKDLNQTTKEALKKRREALMDLYSSMSLEEQEVFFQIKWENVDINDPASLQNALNEVREKALDLEASKYYEEADLDYGIYEGYIELLQQDNSLKEKNIILIKEIALANTKLNEGLKKLVDIEEQSFNALKNENASLYEKATAINEIKQAMEAVFGVELSDDFITTYADQIVRLRQGDVRAYEEIQAGIAQGIINEKFDNDLLDELKEKADFREKEDTEISAAIESAKTSLSSAFNNLDSSAIASAEIGSQIDLNNNTKKGIIDTLASKVITPDEIREYFRARGLDVQIKSYSDGTYEVVSATKITNKTQINNLLFEKEEVDKNENYLKGIEATERELEKLELQKDQTFGENRLALIDQEIAKNQQLANIYAEQEDFLKGQSEIEFEKIAKQLGITPDELKDRYFDESTQSYKVADIRKALGNTEDSNALVDKWLELMEGSVEAGLSKMEAEVAKRAGKLSAIQEAIEFKVAIDDVSYSKVENQLEQLGEDHNHVFLRFDNYANQVAITMDKYYLYADGIKQLMNNHPDGDFTKEDFAFIQDSLSSMLDMQGELKSLNDTYISDFQDSISNINEDLETQLSIIETMHTMTESYRDIVVSLGRENLPETDKMLEKIDNSILQMSIDTIDANKEKLENNKKQLADAQAALEASIGDDEAVKMWEDEIARLTQEGLEMEEALVSSFQSALEAAATLFKNNVDRAIADMERSLAGSFGSLKYMQSFYSQQKDINNLYLDDYEKEYQINKMLRDISKNIDETSNIRAKEKLKELQDEINAAGEEANNLSQQDLDILQKKYDLRLAEIALEEAQNAKTQVRLTKNEAGAWTYVYTANQANIDKAQQNYEDKLYALQKANEDYTNQYTEYLLNLETSFGQGLNDILSMEFETTEKKVEAMKNYLSGNIAKIKAYIDGMKNSVGEDFDIKNTIFGDYDSLDAYLIHVTDSLTSTVNTAIEEVDKYDNTVDKVTASMTGGEDAQTFLNENLDAFAERSKEALGQVNSLGDTLTTTYQDLSITLVSFQEQYHNLMTALNADIEAVYQETAKLAGALESVGKVQKIGVFVSAGASPVFEAGSIPSFDTGGYTGSWGTDGKLAVLHEKELVLNKDDTSNLLATIDALNSGVLNALAMASIQRDYVDALNIINASIGSGQNDNLQQDVTIHAEFPNVTNRFEIEQAFEDIINTASQYANRNK